LFCITGLFLRTFNSEPHFIFYVSHHSTWITQGVNRKTSSSWSCEIFFMCDLTQSDPHWVLVSGNAHSRDSGTKHFQ
jgi:hypothetical protein